MSVVLPTVICTFYFLLAIYYLLRIYCLSHCLLSFALATFYFLLTIYYLLSVALPTVLALSTHQWYCLLHYLPLKRFGAVCCTVYPLLHLLPFRQRLLRLSRMQQMVDSATDRAAFRRFICAAYPSVALSTGSAMTNGSNARR